MSAPDGGGMGGEGSPTLPGTVDGWPVRWERRGRDNDDAYTIGGWSAVIDGPRLQSGVRLVITVDGHATFFGVCPEDLDGEPLGPLAIGDLADRLAEDLLRVELVP